MTLFMRTARRWCAKGNQTGCSSEGQKKQKITMSLRLLGHIELPGNFKPGGFDHAGVHCGSGRLYVAHTANDALDVIDCVEDRYLHSFENLTGVAGALVSDEHNLVFTSNRGENTVGIFAPDNEAGLAKIGVGIRPNGLAYDPARGLLLVANVGDPKVPNSFTLSIVNVKEQRMTASVRVPGRTRWPVFDAQAELFYVNIADPAEIVVLASNAMDRVARTLSIPAPGPHGLDFDPERRRLFCACDANQLVILKADSGEVLTQLELSGSPDVIFFNRVLRHLYVAVGDPGVVDVFDTDVMERIETVPTERDAHTLGFDAERNKVYAFLPETHRAAVYVDQD
jgi:DNA-binding beta-propeller fold protein YncE